MALTQTVSSDVERLVAEVAPDAEVLLVEQLSADRLRIYLDTADGVNLKLCETVTRHLRESFGHLIVEVSSPGLDRPLVKPEHFKKYQGNKIRVKVQSDLDGKKSFTGQLVGSTEDEVTIATESGVVTVSLKSIQRSNLVVE